eukprot:GCRY01002811.1.p1 GENE.GCRY01002811.1~~GCRY01002811.1.p1  ORF type:complete len:348 (+),score=38.21 GCRY01002811.1:237-1280(+)
MYSSNVEDMVLSPKSEVRPGASQRVMPSAIFGGLSSPYGAVDPYMQYSFSQENPQDKWGHSSMVPTAYEDTSSSNVNYYGLSDRGSGTRQIRSAKSKNSTPAMPPTSSLLDGGLGLATPSRSSVVSSSYGHGPSALAQNAHYSSFSSASRNPKPSSTNLPSMPEQGSQTPFFKTARSPTQMDPHFQSNITQSEGELDPRWVTIYGFPKGSASFILGQFQQFGDVIRHVQGQGNWMHVCYETALQAQQALAKNGRIFADVMVGVTPCLDMDVMNQARVAPFPPRVPNTPVPFTTPGAGPAPQNEYLGYSTTAPQHPEELTNTPPPPSHPTPRPQNSLWSSMKEFLFGW